MKRRITVILTALILALILASCGMSGQGNSGESAGAKANGNNTLHTLYFKDITKREDVRAVFYNSNTKETAEIKMAAYGEDSDGFVYACEGDTSAYNMVSFSYDGLSTADVAFNNCVSGWYNSEHGFLPYTEGEPNPYTDLEKNTATPVADGLAYDNVMYDDISLTFNGYKKTIHVRTPLGYDPSSDERYATVYLLDGQAMVYLGFPGETLLDSEHADVQVQSMAAAAGYQAIVVAIETFGDESRYTRSDELIPDLGELAYDEDTKKCGNMWSDFVADTVVPYVQEHYSVYDDALHTSIAGASLGGLEAFYIAMEHPELFGTAGALSPSFWTYDDDTWKSYLKEKNFDEQMPFLYFYSGNDEADTGKETREMVERLADMHYPESRFVYHRTEPGGHEVSFWRGVFSEFLEAMAFRGVKSLQQP